MPIPNLQQAAQQIADFLNSVVHLGGLRLKYRISASSLPGYEPTAESPTAPQVVNVEVHGPDAPLLTQRDGELLRSFEHLAIQILRLDPREHDLVSFDALNFKAQRAEEVHSAARSAAERVLQSGQPYSFPPTNSRERRLLHLAVKQLEGVESASVGEGQERYLVVYPEGQTHLPAPVPVMPSRSGYGDRGNRGDRGGRGDRGDRPRRDSGGYGRR